MLSYDWPTMQKRIFDTESGGDYNALYGYANRPGKAFAGTSITDMTVDQALAFADPSGPYAQSVKSQVGRVATPMGAYQVVGSTLADAKRGLRLTGSEKMTPGLQDMIGKWVLNTQGPGAWEGLKNISKGASDMAATVQPPYMMGGDSTYNVNQREEPRAGLLGLFDRATAGNERTGLNPMQNFAAALDPLIMPELRGGDAIRKQGAQRAGELSRNRTVGMLRQQGQNKIADMLEQGLISGSDAGKYLLAGSKQTFRAATDEEAKTYGAIAGQIDQATGKFFPTQKTDITQTVDSGGTFTDAGAKAMGQNYADMAAAGRDAGTSLVRVAQLETLLDETETGISAGFASKFNQYFGVDFRTAPAAAAEAMISQLVPAQRPPGSGVISDADLALYKASLPQIQALPGGNKLIVQNMKTILEHNRKVGQIASRALTDPSFTMAMAEDEIAKMTEATFASIYSALESPATPTLTPTNADDILLPPEVR